MSTPNTHGDGKDPQESTVSHAAKVFEDRLFPEEEQPDTPPDSGDTSPQPTEPEVPEEVPEDEVEPAGVDTEPAPTSRSRKLKIGDEEVEVSEDEAYLGYLRQQDYTRKTQAAAEIRKEAEQLRQQASDERAQLIAELETAKRGMDSLVPKEPNWAELRAKGVPDTEIAAAVETYQQWKTQRDAIEARQRTLAKQQLDEKQKDLDRRVQDEEEKLLTALPTWRDPATGKAERDKLMVWLRDKKGFTDEQIESIADHRLVVSLYNSMLFEDLQTKRTPATARRPSPRPVAPGSPKAPTKPVDERSRRSAQLAKSGKVADAARVFELSLPD